MSDNFEEFSIELEDDVLLAAAKIAIEKECTIQQVVTDILLEYVEQHKKLEAIKEADESN